MFMKSELSAKRETVSCSDFGKLKRYFKSDYNNQDDLETEKRDHVSMSHALVLGNKTEAKFLNVFLFQLLPVKSRPHCVCPVDV